MKIQIVSDLHLEFIENKEWLLKNPIIPKGDVLVLAGDTSSEMNSPIDNFREIWAKQFKTVIEIFGNHEFYGASIDHAYPKYKKIIHSNYFMLNNRTIIIDDVRFICSCLWSDIPIEEQEFIEEAMNDYFWIKYRQRRLTPFDTVNFHKDSVDFIEEELQQPFKGKTVVITHHLPTQLCVGEKYKDSPINRAFASELKHLFKDRIDLWIHGHSHSFYDMVVGSTRIVRNPLGYCGIEDTGEFKRDFVVELK